MNWSSFIEVTDLLNQWLPNRMATNIKGAAKYSKNSAGLAFRASGRFPVILTETSWVLTQM
jgi:hypothetical protein